MTTLPLHLPKAPQCTGRAKSQPAFAHISWGLLKPCANPVKALSLHPLPGVHTQTCLMWAATTAHTGRGYFSTALLSDYPAGSCYTPSHNILKYNPTPEQICNKFSFKHTSALSQSWSKVQHCRAPPSQAWTQPHRHNSSSSRGWHFRSWEGGSNKKYILLFIHISHGCFVQLWGIPCFLHEITPRTKHLPRRVATVLQEEERRGAAPPTPHSTATSTLEALINLLCNACCFKME